MIATAVALEIALLLSMKQDGQSGGHEVSLCLTFVAWCSSRLFCTT